MWILPSRSRPKNLARFFDAWEKTGASTPGAVLLDADDAGHYADVKLPAAWVLEVGPRARFDELYGAFYARHPRLPWYGFLADDVVPLTRGWDTRLVDLAGRDGLAYGDDLVNGQRHAAHFVLGGELVRAVGWLLLPGVDRLYGDTAWNDLARERGVLRYAPDVVLEHRHFSTGRAPMDVTYRKPSAEADRRRYEEWRAMC
jgi:hypothetical protein